MNDNESSFFFVTCEGIGVAEGCENYANVQWNLL